MKNISCIFTIERETAGRNECFISLMLGGALVGLSLHNGLKHSIKMIPP